MNIDELQFLDDINETQKILNALRDLTNIKQVTENDANRVYNIRLILKHEFEDELKQIVDYYNSDDYVLPF